MIYIIAQTEPEARGYAKRYRMKDHEWRLIYRPIAIEKMKEGTVVRFVGNFRALQHWLEIETELKKRNISIPS